MEKKESEKLAVFKQRSPWYLGAAVAALGIATVALTGSARADSPPPSPYPSPLAQPRIVGGHPVAEQAPVVALYDGARFICGGTLIAADSVLTAAHCASKLPSTEVELDASPVAREGLLIRAGSPNRTEGEVRRVQQVDLHQK
ncbi:MAG: trypsin-like serine protease [Pseudonocardiaceae bacterium]